MKLRLKSTLLFLLVLIDKRNTSRVNSCLCFRLFGISFSLVKTKKMYLMKKHVLKVFVSLSRICVYMLALGSFSKLLASYKKVNEPFSAYFLSRTLTISLIYKILFCCWILYESWALFPYLPAFKSSSRIQIISCNKCYYRILSYIYLCLNLKWKADEMKINA